MLITEIDPSQIKAFYQRFGKEYSDQYYELAKDYDGTKTAEEKWFHPDEGVLPEPLAHDKIDEIRNMSEERKEMFRKKIDEGKG